MTLEEIIHGETKNLEFKVKRPDRCIQYMKTVVAFANGTGGKLIFGIDDKTLSIEGIPKDIVFEEKDAITNAIYASCEPVILPDIYLQTINDKTIIVVEIASGMQRPYFIKSLGMEKGTYVRVPGTTQPADINIIRELILEGSRKSYDQTICLGKSVKEEDISNLCKSMKKVALENACDSEKEDIKDVTYRQLLDWGILIEKKGEIYPTVSYEILTGKNETCIQCGVFKNNSKTVFVDKKEYTGPVWDQIEDAFQFVLRNIHLGAKIVGLYRRESYEIPSEAIRELIINAVAHRNYIEHGNIQISLFDDRLEIVSPGKLPMCQTIESMKQGKSIIRNEALVHALSYMKLMENWGTGIPRVASLVKSAGLKEIGIAGGDADLSVIIYRDEIYDNNERKFDPDQQRLAPDDPNNRGNEGKFDPDQQRFAPDDPNNHGNEGKFDPDQQGFAPDDPNNYGNEGKFDPDQQGFDPNDPNNYGNEKDIESKLLDFLRINPDMTQKSLSDNLNVSEATVKRTLRKLQQSGVVKRDGSNRNGKWVLKN